MDRTDGGYADVMTESEQQREYRTVSYLCSTLANICAAPPNMVIDALTGFLWDEEEAGKIKSANMGATEFNPLAHEQTK